MQILKAARGRITGRYGDRNVPGANVPAHLGTDIGHGDKTPDDLRVVAPAAGTITAAGKLGTYGIRVEIDHGGGYTSILAHLAMLTYTSPIVTAGATVGIMGNTGTKDVHLHQEFRYKGVPVNPELYFAGAMPAGTTTGAAPAPASTAPTQEDDDMPAIQIIRELNQTPNRYGVIGGRSGFSHIATMDEVRALLVGIGQTEAQHVRGVNRVEFDRISAALTR